MMPLERLSVFVSLTAFAALMAAKTLIEILGETENSEKGK